MHHIKIKASPLQLSKLRNGHKVRIMDGEGCNLIVHPNTYHLVSRAFTKNKGINVQLSPEEIQANKQYSYLSPEQHAQVRGDKTNLFSELPFHEGKGLFKIPKKLQDKLEDKAISLVTKHGEKALDRYLSGGKLSAPVAGLQKIGEKYAPRIIDKVIDKGIDKLIGGRLRGRGTYENMMKIQGGMEKIGSPFEHTIGVNPAKLGFDLGTEVVAPAMLKVIPRGGRLGNDLGNILIGPDLYHSINGRGYGLTGYQAMKQAGLSQVQADHALDLLEQAGVHARRALEPYTHYMTNPLAPRSRGQGRGIHTNIGGRNELVGYHHPPALISQPLSSNFQMQHFLPPQYQGHFFTGGGLYT
jgi:hypothetical protein